MKLGFALGGGGARGSAHIGALQELDALGFKPDLVTGTSIGGLVGAMVCAGSTYDEMTAAMQNFKPSLLYSLPQEGRSVTSSERIEEYVVARLSRSFGDKLTGRKNKRPRFDDLDLPLAVTATDLVTKREIVLDDGDLVTALLATISIPVLLPPVQMAGMHLVDGGLVNNLPFDIARARGATFTIAIDLSSSAPYGTAAEHTNSDSIFDIEWADLVEGRILDRALYRATRRPLWQVVTAVIDIVNAQNTNLNLALSPPDVVIRPNLGTIGILDFHTIEQGIEAGRKAVHKAAPQLEKLATQIANVRAEEAAKEKE